MASMSAPPPPPPVPTVEMLSTSNSSPKQDQNASKDGKKWTVVEETNEMWKFEFSKAISRPVEKNDWQNAIGFSQSDEGSGGVVFVGFPNNEVLVVKNAPKASADLYAHELALIGEIMTPHMRLVCWPSEEWYQITKCIKTLNERKRESERHRVKKILKYPCFEIIQFVGGLTVLDQSVQLSELKTYEIGRLVIYDCLINNWDRFELIWDHDGETNFGNLLFSNGSTNSTAHPIVGIDQTLTCLDLKVGEKYLSRIRDLLLEMQKCDKFSSSTSSQEDGSDLLLSFIEKNCPTLQTLASSFPQATNNRLKMTSSLMRSCIRGMWSQISVYSKRLTREALSEILKSVEEKMKIFKEVDDPTIDQNTFYGLTSIKIEWLESILSIFREQLDHSSHQHESLTNSK